MFELFVLLDIYWCSMFCISQSLPIPCSAFLQTGTAAGETIMHGDTVYIKAWIGMTLLLTHPGAFIVKNCHFAQVMTGRYVGELDGTTKLEWVKAQQRFGRVVPCSVVGIYNSEFAKRSCRGRGTRQTEGQGTRTHN